MLGAQAACAIVTIEQLRRRVFPAVKWLPQPELAVDVWTPLILALPMILRAWRVEGKVASEGWIAFGGPVAAAMMAAGAAMAASGRRDGERAFRPVGLLAAWIGAAAFLMLLAAAHDLTLWTGQCAFAIGALLLWMNTPAGGDPRSSPSDPAQSAAGVGMTLALLASVGQGWIALTRTGPDASISGAMVLATAGMSLAAAAGAAGPAIAIRVGGWTAAYGILLSAGTVSLTHLLPRAMEAARTGQARAIERVGGGFNGLAIEASLLLLAAGAAAALAANAMPSGRWLRRTIGMILIAAAAALGAWRLANR